ncbi:citrate synthase [Massiliimalia massiliensis]|jgi:citrate synthase|uniref:citrate synthase n=1 Tax=Massiliimalia massiliensis TaxID=1852384 RepID=UPI0009841ABA|nr:citrate synthase [Massiliimalia massiliensis]
MDEREITTSVDMKSIKSLCEEYKKYNYIPPELYERFDIKRGLRNQDGTGVIAGLTHICNVHGYVLNEGEKDPIDGQLIYRGININDIVENCVAEQRFGFEEVVYLLIFGTLPNQKQLERFSELMSESRELPQYFFDDMVLKAPSKNVMNKLARSVLALYSYDDEAENASLEHEMRKSLQLIARLPNIMVKAYQVKVSHYDGGSMILHPLLPGQSTAETILSLLRPDRQFTREEALLLDICMMLQAEHGGGNNSTFACRVLTSSGTDAYSAYAGAIGSLKGHRHGGANINASKMLGYMKAGIHNWEDEDEVARFLKRIMLKKEGDGTGLIYGMGHAVYTKSDPRALILRQNAMKLAQGTEFEAEFKLLNLVEKLTPLVFAELKGDTKTMCANVDLYSGLVYRMLGIPEDLFTPLFACSRMAGWSAHRIEEMYNNNRIIRPAYKAIAKHRKYIPISER